MDEEEFKSPSNGRALSVLVYTMCFDSLLSVGRQRRSRWNKYCFEGFQDKRLQVEAMEVGGVVPTSWDLPSHTLLRQTQGFPSVPPESRKPPSTLLPSRCLLEALLCLECNKWAMRIDGRRSCCQTTKKLNMHHHSLLSSPAPVPHL